LLFLVSKVNTNGLEADCLTNVPALFEQMLLHSEKINKLAAALTIKSYPQVALGPKVTIYDLATN
jgi:hypothetical protein